MRRTTQRSAAGEGQDGLRVTSPHAVLLAQAQTALRCAHCRWWWHPAAPRASCCTRGCRGRFPPGQVRSGARWRTLQAPFFTPHRILRPSEAQCLSAWLGRLTHRHGPFELLQAGAAMRSCAATPLAMTAPHTRASAPSSCTGSVARATCSSSWLARKGRSEGEGGPEQDEDTATSDTQPCMARHAARRACSSMVASSRPPVCAEAQARRTAPPAAAITATLAHDSLPPWHSTQCHPGTRLTGS